MHLIDPDILKDARQLSVGVNGFLALVGLLLWAFGWRWHRFWVVLSITIAGGLIGLNSGRAMGGHVLAMGVLLALSAGILALELAKILSFIAGGMAVWCIGCTIFPHAQEMWIAFLLGGLTGAFLYRIWTILLTSMVGTFVFAHAAICLGEKYLNLESVEWAKANTLILNGYVISSTLIGFFFQVQLERWEIHRTQKKKLAEEEAIREEERERMLAEMPVATTDPPTKTKRSIWDRFGKKRAA